MKLKTLETYVLDALENNQRARKDDFILYGAVLKRLGVDLSTSLCSYLSTAKSLKMPIFESISRCRRKILETRPDLESDKIHKSREYAKDDFIDYNRN